MNGKYSQPRNQLLKSSYILKAVNFSLQWLIVAFLSTITQDFFVVKNTGLRNATFDALKLPSIGGHETEKSSRFTK